MKSKKLVTEKKFSKKTIRKSKKAIDTYKSYEDVRKQLDAMNITLGRNKAFQTKNNSTKNSKVNFNGIGSTQNFQINTRLA